MRLDNIRSLNYIILISDQDLYPPDDRITIDWYEPLEGFEPPFP